ncbi:MAG: hypothetical protein OQK55_03590 [Thermoanaerobaculales bacterium]|nr:hypothetical protein [Thermoanaerobaculales bacterium]
MARRWLCLCFVVAAAAGQVFALETDQYYAWGRPLADSTDAVNARFNLELEKAIASFPETRPPESCREIAVEYRTRMRFVLLHDIQVWAWNSEWVDRIPDGGEEQREYRRTNLYSNHPLIDTGTWMPFTPTIQVAGVRFGTDKLAHLVSSGWTYYSEYHRGLKKGETPEEAERRAVVRGILEERLILGKMASGVQAIGDIEASYAGIHLYRDLCDVEDPILRLEEGGWVISRPVDLRDYVTPRWDESYQPPIYSKGRWRKVRPVLEGYCERLDDPQVVEMRRRYRSRDQGSVVGEVVAERVAMGKLDDPAQFGLEAVCAEADPSRKPESEPANRTEVVSTTVGRTNIMEDVVAEEQGRRRFALGLVGLHVTYPQVVSASIAVMPTSQPRSYDCTTPCDYRGPFAELEPGIGGAKLSVGWARVTGKTNRGGSFLNAGFIGTAYKLTVLRTWGDHGWIEGGRTYAGFELGVPVAQANLGIGLLYRVDSSDGGRWLVTGGAGWGF